MSVNDVCRLCLAKENLVWIFDKRFESCENMKDVIYITTGVQNTADKGYDALAQQIEMKDIVSQKICDKCCQVTIKMFEFRRTSLKNDNYLREQCKKYLQKNDIRIPNTEITIKSDRKVSSKCGNSETKETKQVPAKPIFKIHPSVRELFKVYPQIRLPTVCLKSHISPVVSMPMDGVESYFKDHNLDFQLYTRLALKSGKVATKRTSAPVKSIIPSGTNSSSSDNKDKSLIQQNHIKLKTENSGNKTVIGDSSVDAGINKPPFKPILTNTHSVVNTIVKSGNDSPSEKTLDKKRKFSEVENSSTKENVKKHSPAESSGLAPSPSIDSSPANTESPAYVANVSVPLHICDICNSVQYSAKDLRKHQNKHLRCQFCKIKFRNFESKSKHIRQNCVIKNTMNNLPDVVLRKIEYSRKIRKKYPDAFVEFPPLKNLSTKVNNSTTESTNSTTNGSSTNKSSKSTKIRNSNDGVQNTLPRDKKTKPVKDSAKTSAELPKAANTRTVESDIIEILSDDEDTTPTTLNKGTSSSNSLLKNTLLKTKSANKGEDKTGNNNDDKPSAQLTVTSESKTQNFTPHLSNTTIPQENIVYNTVSIVKPDIRIKGNNILDTIDPKLSDIKVLKELLNSYLALALSMEKSSQTDLPTNNSILVMNRSDATTELKNLKRHLHVFKIPVVIKNGFFNVTYDYHTEEKQPKKLYLWNDLTPNDIKAKKKSIPPRNEDQLKTIPNASNENQIKSLPDPSNENQARSVPNPSTDHQVISIPTPSNENQIKSVPSPNDEIQAKTVPSLGNENQVRSVPNSGNENQVRSIQNPSSENQVRSVPDPSNENQVTSVPNPSNENQVWGVPISSSENQLIEESKSSKNNNCSILPSTATYHSSGYYNIPTQTANIPQYTPVNNNSVNSLPDDGCARSDCNTLSTIPLLNNSLPASNSSTSTGQPITSVCVPTTTTPGSTNPIGTIRVKSVWELT